MKRRHVWAAAAMLASADRDGAAAANGRALRLGLLWTHEASRAPSVDDSFLAELAKHGYERGRNLVIEGRSAHRAGVDAAAAELVALKVDVIYAMGGTAPALSAKRATSSIPIVFTSADPVAFGLVSSLAHPGGNLTGISIQGSVITAKQMEAMAEALGSLRSMAYIHATDAPSQAWFPSFVAAATSAARALGVRTEFHVVSGLEAYEPLVQELARRKIDAVEPMPGTPSFAFSGADSERIAAMFLRHRLPAIGPARRGFLLVCEFAEDLISRRIAYLVGRIANGTRPADLPVEEFSSLRLIVNAKVARSLGIALPRPLLLRADEVIA